jgi:hypothetical protein
MRIPRTLWAAGILAGLVACSGPAVRYDFESGAEFGRYHTYQWLPAPRPAKAKAGPFDTSIMDSRVKRILEAELAARGFQPGEAGQVDFQVVCYPQRESSRSSQPHLGLGLGLGPVGLGVGAPVGERKVEAIGSLVLEIQDGRNGMVVWKGTAESALRTSDSPGEADAAVQGAVRALLKKFPPPAKN